MTEKKIVDNHRQKYIEITKNCFWIEIADTKHLQCSLDYILLYIIHKKQKVGKEI